MIVITDVNILTMDPENVFAESLAIDDKRIAFVGDEESTMAYVENQQRPYRKLSMSGRTLVPGLIESHMHPTFFGISRASVNCRPDAVDSIKTMINRLKSVEQRIGVSKSSWIVGMGYDDTLLAERRHPNKHDLDEVSRTLPVVVTHISGHFAVANSVALKVAGISSLSADPMDGKIIREEGNDPTGLLWEIGAVRLINAAMPVPDESVLRSYTLDALDFALEKGVTTVHDMAVGLTGGTDAGSLIVEIYRDLANNNRLPTRVRGFIRGDQAVVEKTSPDLLDNYNKEINDLDWFRIQGIKLWADGSIQGLSAALSEPYACCGGAVGEEGLNYSSDTLKEMVCIADKNGYQIAIHTNGDLAISHALDAIEYAKKRNVTAERPAPHRLEHVQVVTKEQLMRMNQLDVNASFFVNHIYYWGDRHRDQFLGSRRAQNINPLRTARSLGMKVGVHSDCPVTTVDPLFSWWCAVNRLTSSGMLLGESERLSVLEGLECITRDAAALTRDENTFGMIRPGWKADLVALNEDPKEIDPVRIKDVEVSDVMIDGSWRYGELVE